MANEQKRIFISSKAWMVYGILPKSGQKTDGSSIFQRLDSVEIKPCFPSKSKITMFSLSSAGEMDSPFLIATLENATLSLLSPEGIAIALLAVIVIFIGLAHVLKNREFDITKNKKVIKLFYLALVLCVVIGVATIYFVNFSDGFLYEIHEILHGNFDDDFGTYRIFLWKRSLSLVKDYPIIRNRFRYICNKIYG